MQLSSILAILALGVSATTATSANLFSNTYCGDDDYLINVGLDKGCHQIPSSNVKAFDVRNIDGGCTGEPACRATSLLVGEGSTRVIDD